MTAAGSEQRLSNKILDANTSAYSRQTLEGRILHLGPGAFFRAHQADYFNQLNIQEPKWGIDAISLRSRHIAEALQPQDWLYTLELRDETIEYRTILALQGITPLSEYTPRAFLNPLLSLVTLTITEKGYCLGVDGQIDFAHSDIVHDLAEPEKPRSALGLLLQGLRVRRVQGLAPPVILCCDNLSANGIKLQGALTTLARAQEPSFATWLEDNICFPSSMVDAITPATDEGVRNRVQQSCGYYDAMPVQREAFTSWVVEVPDGVQLPPLDRVGVVFTPDVTPYAQAKLRMLNGAHSTLAYLGLAHGARTVSEAVSNTYLRGVLNDLMRDEVAPSLHSPADFDLNGYREALLKRFSNPALEHLLSQIAWDGSKKLPIRLLGTISDNLDAARPIENASLGVAAWCRFVVRRAQANEAIIDPLAENLATLGCRCTHNATTDIQRFLELREVFSKDLTESPLFVESLTRAYEKVVNIEREKRIFP